MPIWVIILWCITGLFVIGIIGFLIACKVSKDEYEKEEVYPMCCFMFIILTVTSVVINIEITGECGVNYDYSVKIESLERGSEVSGSFILGCGNIGEDMYYYAYQEVGEHEYMLFKVKANNVVIKETNEIEPCVNYKKVKWEKEGKVTIFVPIGTIRKEFRG